MIGLTNGQKVNFKEENSAERVGFEPTLRYKRKHAFQACAFNQLIN